MVKIMSICFLIREMDGVREICLAEKKRGFRAGKLNGAGGKKEPDETITECARRETQEELAVVVKDLVKVGEVKFYDPGLTHECHIFVITEWEGEPAETEEMKPSWYLVDTIPYHRMGQADPQWLGHLLGGKKFRAHFHYDENDVMYRHEIVDLAESEGFDVL